MPKRISRKQPSTVSGGVGRSLFDRLKAWAKQPAAWLLGIAVAFAGTLVTSGLGQLGKVVSDQVEAFACDLRADPKPDESQFLVLISPLAHDPDRSHTNAVLRAYINEKAIVASPMCNTIAFDYSQDSRNVASGALKQAQSIIKAKHADLLLFGEVKERDNAISLYAVNETGGCDLKPKPIVLQYGDIPGNFNAKSKLDLLAASIAEIQHVCRNQWQVDWSAFGKRVTKLKKIVDDFPAQSAGYVDVATAYIDASRLLYEHDKADRWFKEADTFTRRLLDQPKLDVQGASQIVDSYGDLLFAKFQTTKSQGDLQSTLRAFERSIALDPANGDPRNSLGYLYQQLGDLEKALHYYDEAVRLVPKNAVFLVNRAGLRKAKDDIAGAQADYDAAVDANPDDPIVYWERGQFRDGQEEVDLALEDYDKAIALDPQPAYYNYRSQSFLKKGDKKRAFADIKKSLFLKSDYANTYAIRASLFEADGDLTRAIADFGTAISIDPQYVLAYSERARLLVEKGDYSAAIADLGKAIEIDKSLANAFVWRGLTYIKRRSAGDLDLAVKDATTALALGGDDAFALQVRASALTEKGELDSAIQDLDRAIELKPKIAAYYRDRGDAHLLKAEYNRAIVDFDSYIKLAPTDGLAYWERGVAHAGLNEHDNAIGDFTKAIGLGASLAAAYSGRAREYQKMGKVEQAIADFSRAIDIEPANAAHYRGRGEAYMAAGDKVRAEADFAKSEVIGK
jgi:tetratricopeptide (TPR) repeat protein